MKLVKYLGFNNEPLQFSFEKVVRGMFSTVYLRKDKVLSFSSTPDKEIAETAKRHGGSIHIPDFKHVGYNLRGEPKRAYICPYYHPVKGVAKKRRMVLLDWLQSVTGKSLLTNITTNEILNIYFADEEQHLEPEVAALINLCEDASNYCVYQQKMILDLSTNNFRMDDDGNLILLDIMFSSKEREKVKQKHMYKRNIIQQW